MSINICKECGKEFEASSPRIAYCSAVHYRPCPVCGKPVEAKYLSDPARRCADCKGKSIPKMQAPSATPKVASTSIDSAKDIRTYIGKSMFGFIPGHTYELDIAWNGFSNFNVNALKDLTEDKVVDLTIALSSNISIDKHFTKTSLM